MNYYRIGKFLLEALGFGFMFFLTYFGLQSVVQGAWFIVCEVLDADAKERWEKHWP